MVFQTYSQTLPNDFGMGRIPKHPGITLFDRHAPKLQTE